MTEVPITDRALRGLWADYAWYIKDPVGIQSSRLDLLCARIEAVIEEYKAKQRIPLKEDPYRDYG